MDASEQRPPGIRDLSVLAVSQFFAAERAAEADGQRDEEMPRLDGYRLSRMLGEGGGGAVYYGFRIGSDRPLAVKVLRAGMGDGSGARRAWRELDLLMTLRLSCVPRVIDYGLRHGRLYIATEYVEGLPLDRHCAERGLDRRARVALLARVGDAVQSLHEHGVIHRDLKPSNILVNETGDVTIIDLGVATLLSRDMMETLTQDGAPIGSPAFMAPEQARGERDRISTRTDVYGLGALGYFLLTGQTPFDCSGTLLEVVRRTEGEEPRAAAQLEPTLPRDLGAVLGQAVARRPVERYASAAALVEDLHRWSRGEPVTAAAPGRWTRVVRWGAKHPARVAAGMCGLVALVSVGSTLVGVRLTQELVLRRPSGVRVTKGPLPEIQVVGLGGEIVRRWRVDPGHPKPAVAELVEPGQGTPGRKAMALLYAPDDGGGRPTVFVRDLSNPDRLLWSAPTSDLPLERPPRTGKEADWLIAPGVFDATALVVADLFEQIPGDEIAVAFSSPLHPSAVRVFDLSGKVLYECWHAGTVSQLYWIPGARQLVCSGVCGEASWESRGHPPDQDRAWPPVIFALRPALGVHAGWVYGPEADQRVDLAWYRFFLSWPLAADLQCVALRSPMDRQRTSDSVEVDMYYKDPLVRFAWLVNTNGEVTSHVDTDAFEGKVGRSVEVFRLEDAIPPVR